MRLPASSAFLWTGAAVAGGGALMLATGAWLDLPAAAVVVIAKALPFVVGGAFMAVGAVVGRGGRGSLPRAGRPDDRKLGSGA